MGDEQLAVYVGVELGCHGYMEHDGLLCNKCAELKAESLGISLAILVVHLVDLEEG